ncbi:hypothetical protein EJ06DRAFT_578302 [Trichodelitschia bisporula]|uniref:Uncharacterized protein n=1 Tax=Trichodelitschia bisporula TaxID=703511 RepID=A0A6G1IA39_9PEZI|nr:hypothetical protein EJ06DRAFT_578302 [Trichodelitschia bisporula]
MPNYTQTPTADQPTMPPQANEQQLSKQQQNEIARQMMQGQPMRRTEVHEAEAHAEAQAGLNLNIFGAFKGAYKGRKTKTTDTKKDGSSHSVEHKDEEGYGEGWAKGDMQAYAHEKRDAKERRGVQEVDHLGLGEVGLIEGKKK